jgi:hypothetical protein
VKKREAPSSMCVFSCHHGRPSSFQVLVMRAAFSSLFVAQLALAQAFSPPPLVQAEPDPNEPQQVLQPPAIANQPLDPNAQPPRQQPLPNQVPGTLTPQPPQQAPTPQWEVPQNAQPTQQAPGTVQTQAPPTSNPRLMRIGMSLLLGAGVGTVTAIAGGFIGGEYLRPGLTPIGNIWTGGAIGFAIGAPVGVLISGALFRGNAPWYAPIVGDLIGAAIGAAAIAFGGPEALSAAFALPLLGSVIGSEVASADDATVTPTATILPNGRGGVVGVSGRF